MTAGQISVLLNRAKNSDNRLSQHFQEVTSKVLDNIDQNIHELFAEKVTELDYNTIFVRYVDSVCLVIGKKVL